MLNMLNKMKKIYIVFIIAQKENFKSKHVLWQVF
jgi:hypothetical protein